MSKPFRFVIVGSGSISSTYVNALKNLPEATIAGIVSRSGNRPKALPESEKVEIAPSLAGIKDEFDAVILATPAGLHHVTAIEAANMGKHVLTEKPLEISREAMDKMISACRKQNVKLGVSYQRRMSPDNIVMKKIISEGKMGRVFAADLSVKFYRDDAYYNSAAYRGHWEIDGGGPFMNQASHNIDIYCWFFGMPEKVVSLLGTCLHEIEVEDHGAALLKHENGMMGTIIASTSAFPGFPGRLEIHGEKGTAILENDIITHWSVKGIENPSKSQSAKIHSGAGSAAVTNTDGHEAILRDFIQSVRENRDPAVTGEAGRMASEVILQIYSNKI